MKVDGFFFILIEPLGLSGWVSSLNRGSWLRGGLEESESLYRRVWMGGVEPICSSGQVSTKALAGWF